MLKQHKLMKNFRTEYLSLLSTLLGLDSEIEEVQSAYSRFIGIAHTTILVVNRRNRKTIYTHLSRANGLYNTVIADYNERVYGSTD